MKTSDHRNRQLFVVGAATAVAATGVNAVIYGAGRAAGVEYLVDVTSKGPQSVQLVHVISLSLMSFAVGILGAVIASAWRRPSLRTMQIIGAVLAVVTTWGDFTIDGTFAATLTLALMHLVVGAAYITALYVVGSRRPASATSRVTATHPALAS
jgi:hypothetical protein